VNFEGRYVALVEEEAGGVVNEGWGKKVWEEVSERGITLF
jgi:hypothetical protein